METKNSIIVYENGEVEIEVSFDNQNETIWLSQVQISQLLETSTDNISLHLKNIYKEKELDEKSTTEYFSVVRQEGKRAVKRNIKHYNLDAVISVGYRVSSHKATKFRQWATKVLKEYITQGYTKNISKQLKLDIDKYNQQYENLEIEISNKYHDRFLLIDNQEAYHIGASLKDLGKRVFAFSKIDVKLLEGIR